MTQPEGCPQLLRRTWSDVWGRETGRPRLECGVVRGIIHGECAGSVWRALPLPHSPSCGRQPSPPLLSQPLITLNYCASETLGLFIYYQSSRWALPLPSPFKISQAVPYLSHGTGDNYPAFLNIFQQHQQQILYSLLLCPLNQGTT